MHSRTNCKCDGCRRARLNLGGYQPCSNLNPPPKRIINEDVKFSSVWKWITLWSIIFTVFISISEHKIKLAKCEGRFESIDYKVEGSVLYCLTNRNPDVWEAY